MMDKTKNDALGVQTLCVKFEQCPFCFGCRNFSTMDLDCEDCLKNKKKNICNTEIHKPELIAKMIKRTRITI